MKANTDFSISIDLFDNFGNHTEYSITKNVRVSFAAAYLGVGLITKGASIINQVISGVQFVGFLVTG